MIADFLANHDPDWEHAWIGELDGKRAGSVYCTRESDELARLRLLFVESWARGHGLGSGLVECCLHFARGRGYGKLVLMTNSSLSSARRIYDAFGFRQIGEQPNPAFPGKTLEQELVLDL